MGMENLFELEAPVSALRSSVPFRGRLFVFVLQTGRLSLRGTAARAAYAIFLSLFFVHQQAIG